MHKIFTDVDKWKKKWFRVLPPKYKCFWLYIIENSSRAGIWERDLEQAEFMIGEEIKQTEVKKYFGKRIKELEGGRKWFIKAYPYFQYGILTEKNNAHKGVIAELDRHNIKLIEGLTRGYTAGKDRDKGKDTRKGNDYKAYKEKWNEVAEENSNLTAKRKINSTHRGWIDARVKEDADFFKRYCDSIDIIKGSPELQKKSLANFEFLLQVKNAQSGVEKILEGKYNFLIEKETPARHRNAEEIFKNG